MHLRAELVYSDTPPSLNTLGTRGSRFAVTRAKRRWQAIFEGLLMASDLPRGLGRVRASAHLRFPVRRRRDEGNHRWLLEKALGDALTAGGWLVDDDADRFRFGRVSFDAATGPAETLVRIEAVQ